MGIRGVQFRRLKRGSFRTQERQVMQFRCEKVLRNQDYGKRFTTSGDCEVIPLWLPDKKVTPDPGGGGEWNGPVRKYRPVGTTR